MTTGEEGKYLMQFFHYEQLPDRLKEINKPFCELARFIEATLPNNPQKTSALRKLLESKDCAVRALE
jgi:ferritin-like protein